MSNLRNLVKTRTYRERAQPQAREHLGILEKHKDYVLRARDFHRKEDALQKLREKAYFRNPDEYYMKMAHTNTEGGVHRKRAAEQPTQDELKAFKKEDAGYLQFKQNAEAKKISNLRANLHMLDAPLQNKHTIFVESLEQGLALDASGHGTTPAEAASAPPVRIKKDKKRRRAKEVDGVDGAEIVSAAGAQEEGADSEEEDVVAESKSAVPRGLEALPTKRRAKLERARAMAYSELEQREARHAKMGQALHRIGVEKALMGKGPRKRFKSKTEGAPKVFKWRQRRKP